MRVVAAVARSSLEALTAESAGVALVDIGSSFGSMAV
jgi:hypothetical protein